MHASVLISGAPAERPGLVSICLWSGANKRLDCRVSRTNVPLLGLVLDLLRSSGGLAAAEEADFVRAQFPSVLSGLLCARRIQWAVEGLAEYEASKGSAAAIFVDCGDESTNQPGPLNREWATSLSVEGAGNGQVLISIRASDALSGLPGLTLENVAGKNLRRWSWKTLQTPGSFVLDEQAILSMIQASGRTDPVPAHATHSVAVPAPTTASRDISYVPTVSLGQSDDAQQEGESSPRRKVPLIPILIGSAAVLLIAVLLLVFTHKSPVQSAGPLPNAVPAQTPGTGSNSAASNARTRRSEPHAKQSPAIDRSASKKTAKTDAKTEAEPVPAAIAPPAETHCDLTEEDIQRSLARADRYMHNGDLSDAKAAYLHVLGCPTAKGKAQDGLIRIQRMAAQNGQPEP